MCVSQTAAAAAAAERQLPTAEQFMHWLLVCTEDTVISINWKISNDTNTYLTLDWEHVCESGGVWVTAALIDSRQSRAHPHRFAVINHFYGLLMDLHVFLFQFQLQRLF